MNGRGERENVDFHTLEGLAQWSTDVCVNNIIKYPTKLLLKI